MPEISKEALVFLSAVLTGAALRLAYRCVVCIRQMIRHSGRIIAAEDLIFWTAGAIYVFVQIYYTSDGVIRWYFALGVVLGAVFVSFLLRGLKKTAKKIYVYLKKYFS